ncbi:hypothetical protein PENCOP_c011G04791 [Penicillium coprophilum]|uniref:Tubby C-terminal domain-containing protein n=1 Tax=Penicillium coprophilum TaxID=36646 RepID=A0A1V6UES7_9EURO|nr:hypothetical protein PENCOP_c011G04791 [Penicillium coprophilum]
MSTAYTQSRISHKPSLSPRKALKSPVRHIALRKEYVKDTKTRLVLKPQGDAQSAVAYKVLDEDGSLQFTVTGRRHGDRVCREIRDSSGLPLYELHRKLSLRTAWAVTLPGSNDATLAIGSPRWTFGSLSSGNFTMCVENQAAADSKREDEKKLTLLIERHGNALALFDIVDGDRKVAEVRESIKHNERLPLTRNTWQKYRPALDLNITSGIDQSLVVTVGVILSDWVFGST